MNAFLQRNREILLSHILKYELLNPMLSVLPFDPSP
jgi:hypothetical protein